MARNIRMLSALVLLATMMFSIAAFDHPDAGAHERGIAHGSDAASVSADHRSGQVCDNERDGHDVDGQYQTIYGTVTEYDGGDAGCDYVPYQSVNISAFRLCEEGKGCTAWYRA